MSSWETKKKQMIKDFTGILHKIKKGRAEFPWEKRYPKKCTPSRAEDLRRELIKVVEKDPAFSMVEMKQNSTDFDLHFRNIMGGEFCLHFRVNRVCCVTVNGRK